VRCGRTMLAHEPIDVLGDPLSVRDDTAVSEVTLALKGGLETAEPAPWEYLRINVDVGRCRSSRMRGPRQWVLTARCCGSSNDRVPTCWPGEPTAPSFVTWWTIVPRRHFLR
jgi:hypothetical protein